MHLKQVPLFDLGRPFSETETPLQRARRLNRARAMAFRRRVRPPLIEPPVTRTTTAEASR